MEQQINLHWRQLTPNPLNRLVRGGGEEDVSELAASIRANGVIEPLVVVGDDGAGYTIICGEQRWRAVQLLGDDAPLLPCIVKPEMSQLEQLVVMGVENIRRNGLNPIAEARYYQALAIAIAEGRHQAAKSAGKGAEIKHSKIVGEIVRRTGTRRDKVEARLRLLDLHPRVQELMEQGALPIRAEASLRRLPLEAQGQVANKIIGRSLAGIERAVQIVLERMEREAARVTGRNGNEKTTDGGGLGREKPGPKKVKKEEIEAALKATCAGCEAQREMASVILWENITAATDGVCRRCRVHDIAEACSQCPLVDFVRELKTIGDAPNDHNKNGKH